MDPHGVGAYDAMPVDVADSPTADLPTRPRRAIRAWSLCPFRLPGAVSSDWLVQLPSLTVKLEEGREREKKVNPPPPKKQKSTKMVFWDALLNVVTAISLWRRQAFPSSTAGIRTSISSTTSSSAAGVTVSTLSRRSSCPKARLRCAALSSP